MTAKPLVTAVRTDRRARLSASLLTATALALLAAVAGLHGTPRELVALAVFTFVPGTAVLLRLRPLEPLPAIGLAAAISLAVTTLASWLMIEIGWYVPWVLMIALLAPAVAVLTKELLRAVRAASDADALEPTGGGTTGERNEQTTSLRSQLPFAAPGAVGLLLWALSLNSINLARMTDIGVVSVLPPAWLIGFALILGGGVFYATRGDRNGLLLGAYVLAVATVIYATLPLISDAAHYPAAYKHVGVIELFLQHGHLRPNADIYNRWPGFFTAAGVFKSFAGSDDAIRQLAWAELYFILLQSTLVAAIALRVFRSTGVAALAALLFLTINWIGQNYFSPQALVFVLALAALWVVLGELAEPPNALGRFVDRVAGSVSRTEPPSGDPLEPNWNRSSAIALLLAIYAAIVVSHQLTPYALGLQIGLLLICGFAGPRWLVVAIAALPVLYLLPHLGWIDDHFGIFTKLDPFSNAKVNDPIAVKCDGCDTVGKMATLNSGVAWLTAIAGAILLTRRLPAVRPQALLMLMLAPFLFLGGQNYGGEAPLRVVMFASPFSAALIAGALWRLRPAARTIGALALTGLLAATLLFALYGNQPFSSVSKTEVRVFKYLYANGERGHVIMSAAPTLPDLLTANYTDFVHLNGGGAAILFDTPGEQRGSFSTPARGVEFITDQLTTWGRDAYIVFSPNTDRFNALNSIATEQQSRAVRAALLKSGRFTLWHKDGNVEVYEFRR